MTKSYKLFLALIRVMREYELCNIDLREAGLRIVEDCMWAFGKEVTLEEMRYKYARHDVQVFIELCIKNS